MPHYRHSHIQSGWTSRKLACHGSSTATFMHMSHINLRMTTTTRFYAGHTLLYTNRLFQDEPTLYLTKGSHSPVKQYGRNLEGAMIIVHALCRPKMILRSKQVPSSSWDYSSHLQCWLCIVLLYSRWCRNVNNVNDVRVRGEAWCALTFQWALVRVGLSVLSAVSSPPPVQYTIQRMLWESVDYVVKSKMLVF